MRSKTRFFPAFAAMTFAVTALLCACVPEEDAAPVLNVITQPESVIVTSVAAEMTDITSVTDQSEEETFTEPSPADRRVTFTALGDNLIHSSIYAQAHSRALEKGSDGYDFTYAYEGVADLLDKADITVLNQETLICGDAYEPSTYPRFNSPEALGIHMSELGVDVFTIANNHTLDKGEQGLADCLAYYDRNGFVRVGAYYNKEDRANIRTVEKNGLVISFLSYTEHLNGLSLSENTELQIGMTDTDTMISEIAAAKEISDLCVVSLHWGLENSGEQQQYQVNTAHALAEAGADVIIGNHPHVLREVEIIETSDGRETLCAYSLGNFISAQSVGTNLIGGVLNFEITVPDDGSGTRVSMPDFVPIVTHYDANYANVRLYKLSDYTPELADHHGVRANSRFSYDYIYEYLEKRKLTELMK